MLRSIKSASLGAKNRVHFSHDVLEGAMMQHVFKVGQAVRPRATCHSLPNGLFHVLRLLPSTAGGVPLYCIKSQAELIERVVEQSEIEAAA